MPKLARSLLFIVATLCVIAVSATYNAPKVMAQEAAPAAAPADPAAAAPAEGGEGGEKKEPKSRFMWIVESSGLIGFCLLLLSMFFIATIVRLFMELRIQVAAPPEEVAHCEQLLASRDFHGIYEYARANTSFFSRLVSTGIAELRAGLPEARELMDREAEAETVDMDRKISMLAVLGSLGPMIGLIGTLKGMISSFGVIALSDAQMKASEVAGGISEALILTFEGVALAVPAIFFFAFFKNRVSHISVETLLLADQFIRQTAHSAKPKAGGAAAPAAGAAPAGGAARQPART